MMNIIRADMYRLLRGKALYVTLAVVLFFLYLIVFTSTKVEAGVITETSRSYVDSLSTADGAATAIYMFTNTNILIYITLSLALIVAVAQFTCGAVKNSISTGMPRAKIYAAKWLLSTALCAVTLLLFVGLGVLAVSMVNGAGEWTGAFIVHLIAVYGLQALVITAANSFAIFLAFVTRDSGAVTGIFIAVMLAFSMVLYILSQRFPNPILIKLLEFDLTSMLNAFALFETLSPAVILQRVLASFGIIILTSAAGIALFSKAEIK